MYQIKHTGKSVFLSEALIGEYIMMEEEDDGLEAIVRLMTNL
ncbi:MULTISPECIES: hypothetical protein [Enterobacterales]